MFEEMQVKLRHDVVRALFYAQPVKDDNIDDAVETDLTRAARQSVDNADRIVEVEEFSETNFVAKKDNQQAKKQIATKKKKAHKKERQRKKAGKRRK